MTTVCFLLRGDEIAGFNLSGHTGSAAAGSDILCSAISSAAYLTVNTITDVIGAKAKVSVSDGRMSLLVDQESFADSQPLLKGFMIHMKQLKEQQPHHIRIINVSSGKEHYYA